MGFIDFLETSCPCSAVLVVYCSIRMIGKGGSFVRLTDLFMVCCDWDI